MEVSCTTVKILAVSAIGVALQGLQSYYATTNCNFYFNQIFLPSSTFSGSIGSQTTYTGPRREKIEPKKLGCHFSLAVRYHCGVLQ